MYPGRAAMQALFRQFDEKTQIRPDRFRSRQSSEAPGTKARCNAKSRSTLIRYRYWRW
jgi:hypothetical protein